MCNMCECAELFSLLHHDDELETGERAGRWAERGSAARGDLGKKCATHQQRQHHTHQPWDILSDTLAP